MHPAQYGALRMILGQLHAQNQHQAQSLAQLAQLFQGLAPQPTQQQQLAHQQHQGQGVYMSEQQDQLLDGAMQDAQTAAQRAFEQAAASMTPHHPAARGQGAPQRPNFVPPGGHPPPPPLPQHPGFSPFGPPQSAAAQGPYQGPMPGGLNIEDLMGGF